MKPGFSPKSAAAAIAACTMSATLQAAVPVVLQNESLRAEIVPAWAGRLMHFGRPGGPNVLWTQPGAENFTVDANGAPAWKNVGGEKTWVGHQTFGWRAFAGVDDGSVWPPPAWFDSMPMRVVRADGESLVLRTEPHRGRDWSVAVERQFRLDGDRLVMRQRLLVEDFGADGKAVLPDDWRRLWSVAQVPRPQFALMRLVGEERFEKSGAMRDPEESAVPGWKKLDIASTSTPCKINADADALAAPLADGSGWLLIEQTAPARFLDSFATPGRGMVYASAVDFPPAPYVELEFAAYGPDAEQTLVFSLPKTVEP